MSPEVREYLRDVVKTLEARQRGRNAQSPWKGENKLKAWERRLLTGAKRLLEEDQLALDLFAKGGAK